MRTFAFFALSALASAAPLARRQVLVGQPGTNSNAVNGPSAVSNPTVNNGAMKEGSVDSSTSFDGGVIVNPIGNTLTKVNNNLNAHDNIISNPNVNSASNTEGNAVVGNGNQIFPINRFGSTGIVFKRQLPFGGGSVNAPSAINDPAVNNGAMREGSIDAGLSFAGSSVLNPVGNSLSQLNDNTEVAGNTFQNPNWNRVSGNNGPSLAGNDNLFVPIDNEGMIVNLDPGFFQAMQAHQQAVLGRFAHPGLF